MNPHPNPPDVLHFHPDGSAAGLYTEAIDLQQIGRLEVSRATSIEFNDNTQLWEVFDFTGRAVHSDPSRAACLRWERQSFNDTPANQPSQQPQPHIKLEP
jgi:hypothetical protein